MLRVAARKRSTPTQARAPRTHDGRPTTAETRNDARAPALSHNPAPLFLTVDEVATLLRTSRKAIYAMAERRQLPGLTRLHRRLLVRRDDLLSWLDERRAASPGGIRR